MSKGQNSNWNFLRVILWGIVLVAPLSITSIASALYSVQGADDVEVINGPALGYDFVKSSTNPPSSTAIIVPMPTPPASAVYTNYGSQLVRATCNAACSDYFNRKCVQAIKINPGYYYPTFSCDAAIPASDRTLPLYCMCAFREQTGPPTFDNIAHRKLNPGEFNYSELGAYRFTWRAVNIDRVDVTDGNNFYKAGVASKNDDPLVYVPDHDDAVLTFIAYPSNGVATIVQEVAIGNTLPKVEITNVTVDRQNKRIIVTAINKTNIEAYASGKKVNVFGGNTIFFDQISERTIYIIKAYGYGSEVTQVVSVDPVVLAVASGKVVDKGNNTAEVSWEVEGTSNVRIECATSWIRYCSPYYSTSAKGSTLFTNIDPSDTIFTIFAYDFGGPGGAKREVSTAYKLGGPSITQCMTQGVTKKFGEWQTYAAAASCGINNALRGDLIGALGGASGCMVGSMVDGAFRGVQDCGFDPNGDASCAIGGARLMSQVRLPEIIPPFPTPLGTVNLAGNTISGAIGSICGAPAASACLLIPPPPLPSIGCGLVASMVCQVGTMVVGSAVGMGLCKLGVPLGEKQDEIVGALNTITAVIDAVPKILDFIHELPQQLDKIKCIIIPSSCPGGSTPLPPTTPSICPGGGIPPCPSPSSGGGSTGGGSTPPPPPAPAPLPSPSPQRCTTEVGCGCPYTSEATNYTTQPKSYPTAAKRVVANALMTTSFILSGGNLCLSTQSAYRCSKKLYDTNRDVFDLLFGTAIPYDGDLSQKESKLPKSFAEKIKDLAITCGVEFLISPPTQCQCKGTPKKCVTEAICSG